MAKNKKYEDSYFEEYLETQTIVDVDIEKRMREAFIDYANTHNFRLYDAVTYKLVNSVQYTTFQYKP